MKHLFVIPARSGSKGITGKNIKPLNGKQLIHYSIEYARRFASDDDICLSTDGPEIAQCAALINYNVPFVRPAELATDTVGTYPVLQHALEFYTSRGKRYDAVVLLQPTTPLREEFHFTQALKLFNDSVDMVVSVSESAANPYFNLFEETAEGTLMHSKGDGRIVRRQDAPKVFEYNGSLYIVNARSLQQKNSFAEFGKVIKYEMAGDYHIDLDTPADWEYAEFLISKRKIIG